MGRRNLGSSETASCAIVPEHPEWIRVCRDSKFTDRPIIGKIGGTEDAWSILRDRVISEEQEVFYVICLDSQMGVLGVSEVAKGTANNMGVHMRDIFRAAIVMGSVYMIIAHNHPSGRLDPSKTDTALTKQCKAAGELLGIDVLDHVIVTGNGYWSYAKSGNVIRNSKQFYEPSNRASEPEARSDLDALVQRAIRRRRIG